MDIKWKNFSHAMLTKILVFIITIACFTGALTTFINIVAFHQGDFEVAFEKNYFASHQYMGESREVVSTLTALIEDYKSEENIQKGATITQEEINNAKENLFWEFKDDEENYNKYYFPGLPEEENYKKFEEVYADKIARIEEKLIAEDLKQYNAALRNLEESQGILYFASDGENVFTNTPDTAKDAFKAYPAYFIFDKTEETLFPAEVKENSNYYRIIRDSIERLDLYQNDAIYIAFTEEFLNPRIAQWEKNKVYITDSINLMLGFTAGLIIAFIYLLIIIGRKSFGAKEVQLNFVDRLYNDFNIVFCIALILAWFGAMDLFLMDRLFFEDKLYQTVLPITMVIGTLGLILVLSLVKHIKNGTLIKHSLTYLIFQKFFTFVKDIYNSGSIAVKVVLIVIGYPAIVAMTFFMFPITIGVAIWLAFKKVKEYKAITEGVVKVKGGDLHHKIEITGNGEFAKLAADINAITEGLNKAVANELKSERLKTELITNVSHDIRTPLTSIITYVDLLRKEDDPHKAEEFLNVIDQKSQRLKVLTDDLFEASKASSGNIPVNYEEIDIVSLITQGLGEVDDKIQERELDFKVNYPQERVLLTADGKLLWRAIENLLSNTFKYALQGSRVYIDIEDLGREVQLVIKNISAYELNISTEELMERFKRGDESRSSQGSGLGLSIAKSLVEIQKGSFSIEIDGDLFKAIIKMPK